MKCLVRVFLTGWNELQLLSTLKHIHITINNHLVTIRLHAVYIKYIKYCHNESLVLPGKLHISFGKGSGMEFNELIRFFVCYFAALMISATPAHNSTGLIYNILVKLYLQSTECDFHTLQ